VTAPGPYTHRLPVSAASTSPSSSLSAALAVTPSSTTWHRRLSHPGGDVFAQISRSGDVSCTRTTIEHLSHTCQLGRHVRLPFSSFLCMLHMLLILSTMMCGLLLYSAFLVINICWGSEKLEGIPEHRNSGHMSHKS
jgi:hypothetical protein